MELGSGRGTMLRFDDGVEFDTSGELRLERKGDGFYVVGEGLLISVNSREEGKDVIASLRVGEEEE